MRIFFCPEPCSEAYNGYSGVRSAPFPKKSDLSNTNSWLRLCHSDTSHAGIPTPSSSGHHGQFLHGHICRSAPHDLLPTGEDRSVRATRAGSRLISHCRLRSRLSTKHLQLLVPLRPRDDWQTARRSPFNCTLPLIDSVERRYRRYRSTVAVQLASP